MMLSTAMGGAVLDERRSPDGVSLGSALENPQKRVHSLPQTAMLSEE